VWAKDFDESDSKHPYSAEDSLENELVWSRNQGFPAHVTRFSLELPGPIREVDSDEEYKLYRYVRKRHKLRTVRDVKTILGWKAREVFGVGISREDLEKLNSLVFQRVRWSEPIEDFYSEFPPDQADILKTATIRDPRRFCKVVSTLRWETSWEILWLDCDSSTPEYVDRCCFFYWLRPDPVGRLNEFVDVCLDSSMQEGDPNFAANCRTLFSGAMSVAKFYYGVSLFGIVEKLIRTGGEIWRFEALHAAVLDFTDDPVLVDTYTRWAKEIDASDSKHPFSAEDQLNNEFAWSRYHGFHAYITMYSLEYPGPLREHNREEYEKLLVPVRER
jgi:hypothetical protein